MNLRENYEHVTERFTENVRVLFLSMTVFFTDHVRSTREGNVFTRVCDSVHTRGRGQTIAT